MRRLRFAMALASLAVMSGCTKEVPSEEMASENEPAATSPPKIYQVDSVAINRPGKPGPLTICVEATAQTPGYTNVRLEPATTATPPDGIYDLNLVGDAPTESVIQVLTPITVRHSWLDFPADLKAVRIVAASNASIARLGEEAKGCLPDAALQPEGSSQTLIGGTWLAEDIRGGGVIDNAQSTISFAPEGSATGSGACNRFRGPAKVEGTTVTIGPLAATRMACAPALMDQEQKFLAALEAARSFRLEGTLLKLLDEGGSEIMRLTRLP